MTFYLYTNTRQQLQQEEEDNNRPEQTEDLDTFWILPQSQSRIDRCPNTSTTPYTLHPTHKTTFIYLPG